MSGYNENDADAVEFIEMVKSWLVGRTLSMNLFAQLHFSLNSVQYEVFTDRSGISIPEPKTLLHVKCSVCDGNSRMPDACILNFAAAGDEPRWFCRDHYPEVGGLLPAGWMPRAEAGQAKAEATIAARNKLTPHERSLLNRNIVSVGEKAGD